MRPPVSVYTNRSDPRRARGRGTAVSAFARLPFFRWLPWLSVAAPVGFVLTEAAQWIRNIPRWDEFDSVLDFLVALDAGMGAGEMAERLAAVQNEHRMVASRLVFAVSYALTGGVNFAALAWLGNLFLVAAAALLVWRGAEGAARMRLAWIVALAAFQLQQHENFFWGGASIDHFFVVLAAVAALAALLRPGPRWWAAGAGAAGLASFSLTHGFVVWPAGLVLLLAERRRRAAAAWLAAGAGATAWFLRDFAFNPAHGLPGATEVPATLRYALTIAGSSAALEDLRVAPWLGGLLVAAAAALGRRGFRPGERLAGGVLLWCLGSIALIAWGRAGLAADWVPVASRYLILSSLAWATALWLGLGRLLAAAETAPPEGARAGWRRAARWAPAGLAAGLAAFNVAASEPHRAAGRVLARMSELPVRSYHRHGTFAHAMAPLYPDAARADALIAEAARRGIYRLPAAETLTLAEPRRLALEESEETGDAVYYIEEAAAEPGGTRVRGWAFRPDERRRRGEAAVVFRSEHGLVAYEVLPRLRPDVAKEFARGDASYAGFELRLPPGALPPGTFQVGLCFGHGDGAEYTMTGATVRVPPAGTVARGDG